MPDLILVPGARRGDEVGQRDERKRARRSGEVDGDGAGGRPRYRAAGPHQASVFDFRVHAAELFGHAERQAPCEFSIGVGLFDQLLTSDEVVRVDGQIGEGVQIESAGGHIHLHRPVSVLGVHECEIGADDRHLLDVGQDGGSQHAVVIRLPFPDVDGESDVQQEHFGASLGRRVDRLGIVGMPESHQFVIGIERFLVDSQHHDIGGRAFTAHQKVQVVGFEVD